MAARLDGALEALQKTVSEAHARPAGPDDTVDGVAAALVVAPASTEEVRDVLLVARDYELSVVPRGAATKLTWGNPPRRADLLVDLTRLDAVLEHQAGDLIVRVQAGVRLDALQERVSAERQRLALDPAERAGTIGGTVAANASGPRRLLFGSVRDLMIGTTVVLADGTVAHAGGKVVKNVAGYDLGKLFTGSLGTLGIVTEAVFRLHPLPPAQRVVTVPFDGPEDGGDLIQRIIHSTLVPSAVELTLDRVDDSPKTLTLLFEGVEPSVEAQAAAAAALHPGTTVGAHLPPDFGERGYAPDEVGLKVTAEIGALTHVLTALAAVHHDHGLASRVRAHAASGVLYVSWPVPDDVSVLARAIDALRSGVAAYDGAVVVQQAPSALKAGLDVWGPVGSALGLMRRVKEQFDPDSRMSPGRFVGGI